MSDAAQQFCEGVRSWLGGMTDVEKGLVGNVVMNLGLIPTPSNGHSNGHHAATEKVMREIPIIRTPTADLYVKKAPIYVDVFNLLPVYEKVAYTPFGNIIIKGPKGNGKSISIRYFSHVKVVPLVVVECSENTKDTSLIGSFTLIDKETVFNLGPIPKAIEVANETGRCTLLFEEFNALTPQAQKMLNGVAQERKITVDSVGKTYELKDGAEIWIVGTMNPSIYGGTYDINEDLKSRMGELDVGYAATGHEKNILKTVCGTAVPDDIIDGFLLFANETRQAATGYALSTRDLVRTIFVTQQLGMQTAMQMVICKFEGEDRDLAITRAQAVFKGANFSKRWGGI